MSGWDRLDSRQVCARNRYGDLEPLGRIYRNRWNGGIDYTVTVFCADEQPFGSFRTLREAREYILTEGPRVLEAIGLPL